MIAAPERYAFDRFVLERSQKRLLCKDGPPLELTPRLFDALLLLVEHRGALVDKETFVLKVWPGLVVTDNSVSQVVASLRRVLGDDAQCSRFIQTVPRKGFRFIAPVSIIETADAGTAAKVVNEAAPPLHPAPATPPSETDDEGRAHAGSRRRRLLIAAAGTLAGGGLLAWLWNRGADNPAPGPMSIAVLPFTTIGHDTDGALLGIGITDGLIARLSTVPGLAVRSPAAVRRYASADHDPLQAARELGVDWIVDGSATRRAQQLAVDVRLLRTRDGSDAWSRRFEADAKSLFDLHETIHQALLQALVEPLPGAAAVRPVELGGTRNPEAYQLYLTATWRAQGGSAQDNQRSVALLEQALALDPDYAQAWAMLGWVHRRRLWNVDAPPASVFGPSDEAVRRALTIAPQLALARAGVGFSRFWYAYDWHGAERECRAALANNASEPGALWGLSFLLMTQGRIDEGFASMRRAREAEPMAPVLHTLEAAFLLSAGRLDEAERRIAHALDIAPHQWLANMAHGLILLQSRRQDAGLAALRRAVDLARDTVRPQAMLGRHLAWLGQDAEARAILEKMVDRSRSSFVPPTSLAMVHAALGDTGAALDELEQAFRVRDTRLVELKDDPSWQSLRGEARFTALMDKLGLTGIGPGLTTV